MLVKYYVLDIHTTDFRGISPLMHCVLPSFPAAAMIISFYTIFSTAFICDLRLVPEALVLICNRLRPSDERMPSVIWLRDILPVCLILGFFPFDYFFFLLLFWRYFNFQVILR